MQPRADDESEEAAEAVGLPFHCQAETEKPEGLCSERFVTLGSKQHLSTTTHHQRRSLLMESFSPVAQTSTESEIHPRI